MLPNRCQYLNKFAWKSHKHWVLKSHFITRTPYRQYRILKEYNDFTAISSGIKQYKPILETEKMQL